MKQTWIPDLARLRLAPATSPPAESACLRFDKVIDAEPPRDFQLRGSVLDFFISSTSIVKLR